ncbi:MAG: protein phosphatase 2C domain-containing protein [Cyanobacteria bacterium SID2]|nr:protein phosphatase 2C domain-containing protein [Cyanobacteria bacterium SID2]MBP0005195.1 protein phosphatase 2C domain-containing protein [Cyanobacteria bacterium SBC]
MKITASSVKLDNDLSTWRVFATSVCGTSHQRRGQPCQDAHCWKRSANGVLIAAVADGAGSATRSIEGAKRAVEASIEFLTDIDFTQFNPAAPVPLADSELTIDLSEAENSETGNSETKTELETILAGALSTARNAVNAEAKSHSIDVREFASTLISIVATSDWVAVAQIGDGAAVVRDSEEQSIALTQPQQGEYANQTTFLTSDNALETAQIEIWQGTPTHLALFSDGLQRLALEMPEGKPFDRFFNPLFQFVTQNTDETEGSTQLATFLQSPRVTQRTDDDLTLLLAHLYSEQRAVNSEQCKEQCK